MSAKDNLEPLVSNAAVKCRVPERKMQFARLAFCRLASARWAAVENTLWASEYRREAETFARRLGLRRDDTAECVCKNHGASVIAEVRSWPAFAKVMERERKLTATDYLYGQEYDS